MNWLLILGSLTAYLAGALVGYLAGLLMPALVAALVGYLVAALLAYQATALMMALEKKEPELILLPGAGLRDMLHFIYPPKTAERVFDQIIADMQEEWQAAIINDQPWLARWVQVRGVLTVFLTAAVHVIATLRSILKLVR